MQLIGLSILLLFALVMVVGVGFLAYWPIYGAPYVPTQGKEIEEIFKRVKLARGQVFCDLGCGDGRMVLAAVKITKTLACGVDINWGLIQWCKLRSNKLTKFYCQNIFKKPLPKADIYYLYFWPKLGDKIVDRLISNKVRCRLVTKAFEVKGLKSVNTFEINGSRFWFYALAPK